MQGESRAFQAALALNLATRGSRLGPAFARAAYWIWEMTWRLFFAVRSSLHGSAATFDVQGVRIAMDTSDRTIARVLYAFREYEPRETSLLLRTLRTGANFIDIGANTGYYSLLAAKTVGESGSVIAFEPHPANAEILERNIRLNKLSNVTFEQLAVSSTSAEVRLHLSTINDGDHRIYDGNDDDFYNLGKTRTSISVRAVSLDEYLGDAKNDVDFVKVDVQGAEIEVLTGMHQTLGVNQDVVLMAEFWPHGLIRCSGDPVVFLSILRDLGFNAFQAQDNTQAKEIEWDDLTSMSMGRDSLTLFFSRGRL